MKYYMNIDGVDLIADCCIDEFGLDIDQVFVRGSEQDISVLFNDAMLKTIENECLAQDEQMAVFANHGGGYE